MADGDDAIERVYLEKSEEPVKWLLSWVEGQVSEQSDVSSETCGKNLRAESLCARSLAR